jgi:hypothetical protein
MANAFTWCSVETEDNRFNCPSSCLMTHSINYVQQHPE